MAHCSQFRLFGSCRRGWFCCAKDTSRGFARPDHCGLANAEHVRLRAAFNRSSSVFRIIPTIAISGGTFVLANMPLGLLVDHFFQKGGYTPDELLAKIKELIADAPVRPHLGKQDRAPLWIPRKDADYIVVTCPESLRSSTLPDTNATGDLQETECLACGAKIRYLVDSSILKLLDEKKKRLPAIAQ